MTENHNLFLNIQSNRNHNRLQSFEINWQSDLNSLLLVGWFIKYRDIMHNVKNIYKRLKDLKELYLVQSTVKTRVVEWVSTYNKTTMFYQVRVTSASPSRIILKLSTLSQKLWKLVLKSQLQNYWASSV